MKILSINQLNSTNKKWNNGCKKVSFGRVVNGTDYPDNIVKEAERLLKENAAVDPQNYKKSFLSCWEDASFQPVAWLFSPYAKMDGSLDPVGDARMALGIATLGISELLKTPEAAIRKIVSDVKTDKYVAKLKDCMIDLMKEKALK